MRVAVGGLDRELAGSRRASSNRRANRLAFMMVFRARSCIIREGRLHSKNARHKATETVCMTNSGKRVAWITGGGSGIGEAGAEALAADGWTVVVSGAAHRCARGGGREDRGQRRCSRSHRTRRQRRRAVSRRRASKIVAAHGRIDLSGQFRRHQRAEAQLGRLRARRLGQAGRDQSQRRAVLHARGAAGDAGAAGRLHHQRVVLGRTPRLEDAGPGLHHHQARGAGADAFVQHGRMRQRAARLLPDARPRSPPRS